MRKTRRACILWCVVLGIASLVALAATGEALIKAEVVAVVDGDTFDAYILAVPEGLGAALAPEIDPSAAPFVRVRLSGIDSPEIDHPTIPCECFGEAAAEALRQLLPEATVVWLELDERVFDDYRRLLAYAYLDPAGTQMVNALLAARGHAVSAPMVPNIKHEKLLSSLEAAAREGLLGLWGDCVFAWDEAASHINERAAFTGHVESTYYDDATGVTFINLGLPYPAPGRLTVTIRPQVRALFTYELGALPEDLFLGSDLAVFGQVKESGDSYEILLWEPEHAWALPPAGPGAVIGEADVEPSGAASGVVIWEVEVNPPDEDRGNEWVKLRNLTDEDIHIGGWLVVARAGQPGAIQIEDEAVIHAGGVYVVGNALFLWLDNVGEYIELRNREGLLLDATPFGALDDTDNSDATWRREE